jgi:hypothetical protein
MTGNDTGNETPISSQGPIPDTESTPQVGKACLDIIEAYRKGSCNPLDKASAIGKIAETLTSTAPKLTETEVNDSLGTYLQIIEQHERSLEAARINGTERSETADISRSGTKRASSPEDSLGTSKKQKADEGDFPWVARESISGIGLSDDLQRTLELLRVYAKDLKFTKSSILTSSHAPQFPNSEWSNIITGAMVDLDHVISGSFAVSNDNRSVESIGGIQFKFGAIRAVKQVKTSGDWFIAWNLYSKAVAFAFPHRLGELSSYSQQILGLFSATSPGNHTSIIFLDKAIRVRVGERRDLLLTDNASFEDLRLYWLNPIGAGDPSKGKDKPKSDFRCEDPCDRWNRGVCRSKASECKYRHVCKECGGKHRADECKSGKGGST